MANPVRIGNKQKISGEEFIDIIKKVHVIDNVEVEGPRTGDNKSGKFNLYKFKTEDGYVAMYLAGGGNEAEKYEQDFVSQAKSLAGEPNNTLPVRLQTLYKGYNKYEKYVNEIDKDIKLELVIQNKCSSGKYLENPFYIDGVYYRD